MLTFSTTGDPLKNPTESCRIDTKFVVSDKNPPRAAYRCKYQQLETKWLGGPTWFVYLNEKAEGEPLIKFK